MLPNCGPWALPLQNGLSVLSCCWSHMQCTHTLVPQGLLLGHNLIHIPGHGLFQMSLPHCSLGYPPVDGCWHAEAGQRWQGSRPPCHLWPPGKKGATKLCKGQNGSAQAPLHGRGKPSISGCTAFTSRPAQAWLVFWKMAEAGFQAQQLLLILQYFASWFRALRKGFLVFSWDTCINKLDSILGKAGYYFERTLCLKEWSHSHVSRAMIFRTVITT